MNDYRIVEVTTPQNLIISDQGKKIVVETNRAIEYTTAPRVIEVSKQLKYYSNKMTFVVGTSTGTPVSTGDKETYGTRFNAGTVMRWTATTDQPTNLSARIRKSSSFPIFADILTISLSGSGHATGDVAIPLADLDVLNLVIDSNTAARRIIIELYIQ